VAAQGGIAAALNEAFVSLHSEVVRTESRSAHARENYPTRDDANCLKHTLAWLEEDGRVLIDYRPVHLTTLPMRLS
jgi:succinate dehydrogenase / fumarate reductase, flavoprotein subunit